MDIFGAMRASPFRTEILDIENLIRRGRHAHALHALQALRRKKLHRNDLAPVANLARRLNLPAMALRLLHPLVRPLGRKRREATPLEVTEYAAALIRAGARREAESLLLTVAPSAAPVVSLYLAFASIAEWNYRRATPQLRTFLESSDLSVYDRAVGQTNLVCALVYEGHYDEARSRLEQTLALSRQHGFLLLQANLLDYGAQCELANRHWQNARAFLSEARRLLMEDHGLNRLFVEKWQAVLQLEQATDPQLKQEAMRAIRGKAHHLSHWETVRDCDFHLARALRSFELFSRLYAGTPYPHYRRRLRETALGLGLSDLERISVFEERLGSAQREPFVANLITAELTGASPLKPGQTLHRTLRALASDAYRPYSLMELHANIFPEERFSFSSSIPKVHQALKRLRKHFLEEKFPLEITQDRGLYRIQATRGRSVTLVKGIPTAAMLSPDLARFAERFQGETFTRAAMAVTLDISPRSAQRLIAAGLRKGELGRHGKGAGTRYCFLKKQ